MRQRASAQGALPKLQLRSCNARGFLASAAAAPLLALRTRSAAVRVVASVWLSRRHAVVCTVEQMCHRLSATRALLTSAGPSINRHALHVAYDLAGSQVCGRVRRRWAR